MNEKDKDEILEIMSFLDKENESFNISNHEDLILKIKDENNAIRDAFNTIEDMEDISLDVLKKIKEESKPRNRILLNLIPVFVVCILYMIIRSLLIVNSNIGSLMNLFNALKNMSFIFKGILKTYDLNIWITNVCLVSIIIIFLIKKGCLKDEI